MDNQFVNQLYSMVTTNNRMLKEFRLIKDVDIRLKGDKIQSIFVTEKGIITCSIKLMNITSEEKLYKFMSTDFQKKYKQLK